MRQFFYLEGAYLILAAVILAITLFVTTRPFMGKGALKKGMIGVGAVLALAIGLHYWMTTQRMHEVVEAFNADKPVICESRMVRLGGQSVIVRKSHGWRLKGDNFYSDAYVRPFFTARCVVYHGK